MVLLFLMTLFKWLLWVKGGFNEIEGLKEVVPVSFVHRLLVGVPCKVLERLPIDNTSDNQASVEFNVDDSENVVIMGINIGGNINVGSSAKDVALLIEAANQELP